MINFEDLILFLSFLLYYAGYNINSANDHMYPQNKNIYAVSLRKQQTEKKIDHEALKILCIAKQVLIFRQVYSS